MNSLELLAPARNKDIGIAAIDCGADAVYMAGPKFGARASAGNSMEDLAILCSHAHRFGSRIFVTLNTILYEEELDEAASAMMQVQEAGVDAIIVQDLAILRLAQKMGKDFRLPLHASTQCAIRTPEQAAWLESLGFSRLILERELSLEQIRAIRKATSCELEFFVHGALCVCYSGQCYLSEMIAGRSANRGACIQACRSKYDLVDRDGKTIVRDKALLSLKDYRLKDRMAELAEAGISSFKIEGRLKNESYVRNTVLDYSAQLDRIIESVPGKWERASFGKTSGGFTPDLSKTFNRGFTELFIDSRRGKWASMDAAKSMGEEIGTVSGISKDSTLIQIAPLSPDLKLSNGDGFSFVARDGNVVGFRGDVCNGFKIRSKAIDGLFIGARIFRNLDSAFEKEIQRSAIKREVAVKVDISVSCDDKGMYRLTASAISEDGRRAEITSEAGNTMADNQQRIRSLLLTQFEKSAQHYRFHLGDIAGDVPLPLVSAACLNEIRRSLADALNTRTCIAKPLLNREIPEAGLAFPSGRTSYKQNISNSLSEEIYSQYGAGMTGKAYELEPIADAELMRTKYCIRYELGLCPKYHPQAAGKIAGKELFLHNNGRYLALGFDCARCEMTVKATAQGPQK